MRKVIINLEFSDLEIVKTQAKL